MRHPAALAGGDAMHVHRPDLAPPAYRRHGHLARALLFTLLALALTALVLSGAPGPVALPLPVVVTQAA
jgi:hypothetical protein